MSNMLTLFDSPTLAVPDYLRDLNDEGNIEDRQSVPSLSYEGKVWTISANGEKIKLMKRDADGDEMPVGIMKVVILDYAKRRGRSYYPNAYDPSKVSIPECWSDDGLKPHPSVPTPQCATCEGCPMAIKGSKVTEQGKAVTACSQHRMLAVVPANKLDMTPLRMKLAVTSDYDKESPELEAQGWFSFSAYLDFLRSKGISHTGTLVTKMKFDPNVAYPKVKFSPDRWVEASERPIIKEQVANPETAARLAGTYTPNGVDGKKLALNDDGDEDEAPKPKLSEQAKAKAPAQKAKAPVVDDDEDEIEIAPRAKAAPRTVVDDDEDEAPAPKPKAKAAAKPKAAEVKAEVVTDVPDDVAALLDEWDDE